MQVCFQQVQTSTVFFFWLCTFVFAKYHHMTDYWRFIGQRVPPTEYQRLVRENSGRVL